MRCTLLLLHWIHVCFSMLTKASFLMPTLHGRIPTFCLLKKPLTIIIPAAHQGSNGGPTASLPQLPYNNAYNRVKDFLKDLLRNILERHVDNPDEVKGGIFEQTTQVQTVTDLHHQLEAYWRNEYPFNSVMVKKGDPLTWWQSFCDHPNAQVLAVCTASSIFVMLPTLNFNSILLSSYSRF